MSNNLTKIREMATSIKNKLASLTINPDALDDLDSVSSERVMLREKLATLEAAETVERDRIVEKAQPVDTAGVQPLPLPRAKEAAAKLE